MKISEGRSARSIGVNLVFERFGIMKPGRARAWLDDILAGLEPDAAALDRLIDECGTENLHHEYKAGAELVHAAKGGRTLRQYTAGFANADGGMLLVGVGKDQGHTIDGCPRPGGLALHEWAARSLASQMPYFSPQPRMFAVPYLGPRLKTTAGPAEVLIIAVQRSPLLVPCVEGGHQVFYFRIGDSTVPAPDYLLADMILGRRSHPAFEIHPRFHKWGVVSDESSVTGSYTPARRLVLELEIENASLVFAENIRAGLITWRLSATSDHQAPGYLLPSVFARRPPEQYPHDPKWRAHWMLAHLPVFNTLGADGPVHLAAFQRSSPHRVADLDLPVPNDVRQQFGVSPTPPETSDPILVQRYQASLRGRARLEAALYVVARGSPPTWFQLVVRYQAGTTQVAEAVQPEGLIVAPVGTERPHVAWDYDVEA